jgi:hypothetical protein
VHRDGNSNNDTKDHENKAGNDDGKDDHKDVKGFGRDRVGGGVHWNSLTVTCHCSLGNPPSLANTATASSAVYFTLLRAHKQPITTEWDTACSPLDPSSVATAGGRTAGSVGRVTFLFPSYLIISTV